MSHLPLDARAILHYLNDLGYRNITAEQLRAFLKDLRKLIKHEERLSGGVHHKVDDCFNKLHKHTTASYRAKIDKENVNFDNGDELPSISSANAKKALAIDTGSPDYSRLDDRSMDKLKQAFRENLTLSGSIEKSDSKMGETSLNQHRSRSRLRCDIKKSHQRASSSTPSIESRSSGMLKKGSYKSKRRSLSSGTYNVHSSALIPRPHALTKNPNADPVELYQYYKSEWDYFRNQIPGDTSHLQLRWQIRHKFLNPR